MACGSQLGCYSGSSAWVCAARRAAWWSSVVAIVGEASNGKCEGWVGVLQGNVRAVLRGRTTYGSQGD